MNGQQNHYFVALGRRGQKPVFHSSQPTQQNDRGFVAFRVKDPISLKTDGVYFFIAAIGGVLNGAGKKISDAGRK